MCVKSYRDYMELATLNLPKRFKAAHRPKTMPAGHSQGGDNRTATWPCNSSDSPALSLWWSNESVRRDVVPTSNIPIFYSCSLGLVMLKFITLSTIKQNKISGLVSIMAKTAHLQISPQAAQP